MNVSLAILLGAGFSRWAADLPIVGSLFDFQIEALNAREELWLNNIRTLKTQWDDANPVTHPEEFVTHILENGKQRQRLYLLWYLSRRLSDPFLATITHGIQTLMFDDSRKMRVLGIQRALQFFQQVERVPLVGVVTPNYDLLVEYALGTNGFNYGIPGEILEGRGKNHLFPWQGARPVLVGNLPIAKVHGSLSWANGVHFTDGRCGLRGKADIVPPVREKERPDNLIPVWELAEHILSVCNAILVFGFAFNPYDVALLELLESGSNVKNVLLVDPSPPIDRAHLIWPNAKIEGCSPPSSNWNAIDAWLESIE